MEKRSSLFILLLVLVLSLQANIQTKIMALKKLLTHEPNLNELRLERERLISEARRIPPKGEFEKEAQYSQRVAEANRQVEQIRTEYAQREQSILQGVQSHKRQIQAQIDALLAQGVEQYVSKNFRLGNYNAEKEEFPVNINEINTMLYVSIPQHRARSVKENISSYVLEGTRYLNESLKWEYKNWYLKHQNELYVVGKHEELQQTQINLADYKAPNLVAQISFSEPSGNKFLDAEESGELIITLENKGDGEAFSVGASIKSKDSAGINFDKSVYFGNIPSRQSVTKRIAVRAEANVLDKMQKLDIEFSEQMGMTPPPQSLAFESRAMREPLLALADRVVQTTDRKVYAGSVTELVIIIQNQGMGMAKGVGIELFPGEGITLLGIPETASLGDIAPGGYAEHRLSFAVPIEVKELPFHIRITEERSKFNTEKLSLNLPFVASRRPAQVTTISGKEAQYNPAALPSFLVDTENDIPQGKSRKNAYAIILGIEDYQNLPPATYALRDAQWVKEYFKTALGIPEANIISYENDKVTRSRLATIFDENYFSKMLKDKDDELYIYYSGHGAPPPPGGNQAYLAAWDADFASIENTCYPVNDIYLALNNLKTQNVTVFLDACFSGVSKERLALKEGKPVFIAPTNKGIIGDITLFAAAEADEIAHVYDDKQHGMFTYHLLKGIHNRNADKNKDGKISVQELHDFVSDNVPSAVRIQVGEFQNPQVYSNDPNRILVEYK